MLLLQGRVGYHEWNGGQKNHLMALDAATEDSCLTLGPILVPPMLLAISSEVVGGRGGGGLCHFCLCCLLDFFSFLQKLLIVHWLLTTLQAQLGYTNRHHGRGFWQDDTSFCLGPMNAFNTSFICTNSMAYH